VKTYEALNIAYSESKDREIECLEIIQRAWQEDNFSYKGKFYDIQDVTVVPQPVQQPRGRAQGVAPEIKFAGDSLLEGDGFELPVPRQRGHPSTTAGEAASHREPVATSPERSSHRAILMMALSVSFSRNWRERWTEASDRKRRISGMVTRPGR
jgi:alkanesulfonate monooxygenase SsuD/methylene tetrahydromethanopterin reductase-like flavin-dependent oxidoreductase (luciferase family)